MTKNIIHNGVLLEQQNFSFPLSNRSFRYGDGFFETIRCSHTQPLWWPYHFQRIHRSAGLLKMVLPDSFTQQKTEEQIHELLDSNKLNKGARLRLSFFRAPGGFYKPQNNSVEYIMETEELESDKYSLNKAGLNVGVYSQLRKACNMLGGIKSCSAQLYVMASLYAEEKNWNDAVILNETGHVAEATSSNIFMVSGNTVYTPDLDQACVDGVMRRVILDIGNKHGYKFVECAILPDDLLKADEVFITNAIKGIQWVKGIKNKRYYHEVSSALIELLQKESEKIL